MFGVNLVSGVTPAWAVFAVILAVAAVWRLVNLDLDAVQTDVGNYAVLMVAVSPVVAYNNQK